MMWRAAGVVVGASVLACAAVRAQDLTPWPAERIWGGEESDPYCAFTDLIRAHGRFYCAFREGTSHVYGRDGRARVIVSEDGRAWRSVALLAVEGVDLRDPKLSVTPDGRVMVVMGGSVYDGRRLVRRDPMVAFSDDSGDAFGEPAPVAIDPAVRGEQDWLWRVTWHEEHAYGVLYQPMGDTWGLHLLTSGDGVRYQLVRVLNVPGRPNETTVRFTDRNRMIALVRREGEERTGCIGTAEPPYVRWSWAELPLRLGGPNFVCLDDGRLIAGTRGWVRDADGQERTATILALLTTAGAMEPILRLPSGGDTGYPGMLVDDGSLWVSYYSSHEQNTAIYLAQVPVESLERPDR